MADPTAFTKMVPGFDFLQGLVKNAGSALPSIGQWVAPTLNPEELDKRIEELKTVQFWLEQNARMLSTTIQALEVQRMTLSTLKTMNVPVAEIGQAVSAGGQAAAAIDPMQWWGALTKQFTQLAANTMKDGATDVAKDLAGAMMKQGFGTASKVATKMASTAVRATQAAAGAGGAKPKRASAKVSKSAPRRKAI